MSSPRFDTLLRLEWRLWRAEGTPWLLALAVMAGTGYATGNGLVWLRETESAMAIARDGNQARFDRLRDARAEIEKGIRLGPFVEAASPFLVGDFAPRYAAIDPRPLALFAVGQSDVYPSYFRITGERRDSFIDAEENDHPLNLGNGRFDMAFFASIMLPMLLLAVSVNLVSTEREQGTLAMTLAQPLSFARLLAARITVRAILVMGALATTSTVAVLFNPAGFDEVKSLLAYGLAGLGVALSVAWWLVIGAAISLRGWSSTTNALVGLGIWLATAIVAPVAIHGMASIGHSMPSRVSMLERTRDLDSAVRTKAPALLTAYYADRPAERPPNLDVNRYDFALHWTIIQREVNEQMATTLGAYEEALSAQQRLSTRLAWLSLPVLLQEMLTDLAGTGARRHLAFLSQIARFHDEHRAFFDARTLRRTLLTVEDYADMPTFTFADEPLRATALHATPMLMVAAFWVVATGLLVRARTVV